MVLPILREALPGVAVVSVVPDADYRTFPMVVIRRAGGTRNPNHPAIHSLPEVTMEAVSADGLIEAEELYDDALEALYAAVANQTVVPNALGHLQSLREAQGATQSPAELPDTWSVQGKLRLGLRAA
ncbi:hypothetical protein [Mycolicibacterium pyrenivorans]|uniref:hypothetical protein n=1 Tax=Mycolicibacterium pyrenivorans TaxID=187102 RepID=UPI0021F39720|nr:hypothetical protein [Mycolicibacterium pyrenivorans]